MATPGLDLLVTGSEGYIGTLLRGSLSFHGLDRATGTELDDFDPGNFRHIRHVIHLADRRLGEIRQDNLSANIDVHRRFFAKLHDLPRLENVTFASSCSVYGSSPGELDENSPVHPTSFYAESKLATEGLLRESGLPSRIIRFGTAFGWSPRLRQDLLVNHLAEAVVRGESLDIHSPDGWRAYIHARDFAGFLSVDRGPGPLLNAVSCNHTKREILGMAPLRALKTRFIESPDPRDYRVRPTEGLTPRPLTMAEGLEDLLRRLHDRPH